MRKNVQYRLKEAVFCVKNQRGRNDHAAQHHGRGDKFRLIGRSEHQRGNDEGNQKAHNNVKCADAFGAFGFRKGKNEQGISGYGDEASEI